MNTKTQVIDDTAPGTVVVRETGRGQFQQDVISGPHTVCSRTSRRAFGTICGIDPLMPEADLRLYQGKLLAIGVEPQRHRRACAGRREQELVRT
jgi:hypothetical protein